MIKSFLYWMSAVVCAGTVSAAPLPNIVILLADDLGYGDLSIHGGETPTPRIDKLFELGVELSNFRTWAVCSPSRAGLLTGINPIRIGQGPVVDGTLDPDIMTFGRAFQQHGYKTGIFGKWHNSNWPNYRVAPGSPSVNAYGFDRWVGFYGGGEDFFTRVHCWEPDRAQWWHDENYVPDEPGYTTDLIADHAIEFMKNNRDENFVCYIPFSAIHNPYHAKEEDLKRVPQSIIDRDGGTLRDWKEYYKLVNDALYPAMNDAYMKLTGDQTLEQISGKLSTAGHIVARSAMLINLDDNIGRILDCLRERGLDKNTVVWFLSDNGALHEFGDNGPFRGGKHSILEGGIRSPAVVRWPDGKLSNGWRYDGLLGNLDVYPTSMAMAGLPMPAAELPLDGKNCLAAILNDQPSPVDAYYFLWQDKDAVATSDWKLFRTPEGREMYHLTDDPAEERNVVFQYPEKAKALEAKLDRYMTEHSIRAGHVVHESDAAPNPTGNVLEVSFRWEPPPGSRKLQFINLAWCRDKEPIDATDCFEYDIRLADDSAKDGLFLSPLFHNQVTVSANHSVDSRGQKFDAAYSQADAKGKWIHRSVGTGQICPALPQWSVIAIAAKEPGFYHFYLDNVVIQKPDGRVSRYWQERPVDVQTKSAPGVKNLIVRLIARHEGQGD